MIIRNRTIQQSDGGCSFYVKGSRGCKVVVGCKTYQAICDIVNVKYLTSFSRSIARTSLKRYYTDGVTSAKPRGPRPKVSDTLVNAVNLHASMMGFNMNALRNKKIRYELGQSSIKTDPYIVADRISPSQ